MGIKKTRNIMQQTPSTLRLLNSRIGDRKHLDVQSKSDEWDAVPQWASGRGYITPSTEQWYGANRENSRLDHDGNLSVGFRI